MLDIRENQVLISVNASPLLTQQLALCEARSRCGAVLARPVPPPGEGQLWASLPPWGHGQAKAQPRRGPVGVYSSAGPMAGPCRAVRSR